VKDGMRTTRTPAGIRYEVLRNGQVLWSKFLKWGRFRRERERYEAAAKEQERIALKGRHV